MYLVALLFLSRLAHGWIDFHEIIRAPRLRNENGLVLQVQPDLSEFAPLSNREDHLVKVLSGNGEVLVKCITARNLVQDAVVKQNLKPLAADALGRAMICTLLCASGLKDKETLQLTFADGEGGVRGYVGNGSIDMGKFNDVGIGIGQGVLKVVRNHPTYERPYSGIVELKNSQVAFDVAGYLLESQQSESVAVASGLEINEASVKHAGGYLVETLPGASKDTIRICSENLTKLMEQGQNPSSLFASGMTPMGIAEKLLTQLGGVGSFSLTKPFYKCHCTSERLYQALRLLGKDEVREIIEKHGHIEAKCDFCGKVYRSH